MIGNELELVSCKVVRTTEKAFQLQELDGDKRTEWFPQSFVSFKRRNANTGEALAEIPMWLLKAKGWDQ